MRPIEKAERWAAKLSEHPVIFSGPSVRAIRAGRKTQTRRCTSLHAKVGETLWVRETWAADATWDGAKPGDIPPGEPIWYRSDPPDIPFAHGKWRPSIFMPRWASRIDLDVTGVRREHVQEIMLVDCFAEGVPAMPSPVARRAREYFECIWDELHGKKPGRTWADNPEVFVYEFGLRFIRTEKGAESQDFATQGEGDA